MKIKQLLQNNQEWSDTINREAPDFFPNLANQQSPEFLWIGCSDSRVPANEIVGLLPGELFVHRNVANLVVHTDFNCLSVIQFAVDVLKVKHIIVCGHYGCGGVRSALLKQHDGLINNWLRHIQDVEKYYLAEDSGSSDASDERINRMCELNVVAQVDHVSETTFVRDAWKRGQSLKIHGWIYGIHDGRLKDLGVTLSSPEGCEERIKQAADRVIASSC